MRLQRSILALLSVPVLLGLPALSHAASSRKLLQTCQWTGHCLGDRCSTNDDCDNDWVCKSGKCALPGGGSSTPSTPSPRPQPSCSWPGHCLGDSCRTENDCDGMMVCTNGKCANPGGSSNIPTTPSTPTVKPPTNPVNPPVNPPTNTPQGTPINSVNLRGLTPTQGRIIFQLTSLFENSTPNLQYNYIEDINDGRGYTFGYVGFCTGTGDGYPFVRDYYLPRAPNSPLRQYLPALQQLANSGSAAHTGLKDGASDSFVNIVKGLGNDGAWRAAMDAAVDAMYFAPAMSRAAALGLTSALGRGQMYDAYINHGESGVLDMIPKVGGSATGDEKGWLGRFLAVRKQVLQADSTWAESVDRVNVYQQLLNANNMDLSQTASFTVYGTRFAIVSTANGLTVQ